MKVNKLTVEVPVNTPTEVLHAMCRITGRLDATSYARRYIERGGYLTTGSYRSVFGYSLEADSAYLSGPILTVSEFEQVFL